MEEAGITVASGATNQSDAREIARTNLFLAATLLVDRQGGGPVKVRNLSPTGAMVEAAVLPSPGTAVHLVRGSLQVGGRVAWSNDKRCGIAFDGAVTVREWMAPPANREQDRVDAAFASLRRGAPATGARAPSPHSLPDQLELAGRLLEELGDALCSDPAVLVEHGVHLQKLDIAAQMIAAGAAVLRGEPEKLARLADLRASAEQALRPDAA